MFTNATYASFVVFVACFTFSYRVRFGMALANLLPRMPLVADAQLLSSNCYGTALEGRELPQK